AEVRNGMLFPATLYAIQPPAGNDLADGNYIFSYLATTPLTLEPFFIHDLIANTAYEYLASNTTWTNDDKATIQWPVPNCVPLLHTPNSCYYSNTIHLMQADGWDGDVILHEYGHFVLGRPEHYDDSPVVFACQGVG